MTEINEPVGITEEIENMLNSLLAASSFNIQAVLKESGNDIHFDIEGEDEEQMLMDGASLLYAFNHLINQIYFRRLGRGRNIVIDCLNYRSDRELELLLMADKAAEQALATGRKLVLQPMNSAERRIIHMRLAEEDGIRTESEGTGLNRRVSILPV